MPYKYTSLEDDQIIITEQPREDLDELARWERDEITAEDAAAAAATTAADPDTGSDQNPPAGGDGDNAEPTVPALDAEAEEWRAYAKHTSIALDIAEDADRDAIVAAFIEKFAPAGNASGDAWAAYAGRVGVTVDPADGRDKIRAAVTDAGWAKA